METHAGDTNCRCCDPRCAAVALGRWALGLLFLVFGIGKLGNISGFAEQLTRQFEKTWLPAPLVNGFGHALPLLEVTAGALLIVGLFRNVVLFATAMLLLVLSFGQMLLMNGPTVFSNTVYLFMVATLLFLHRFDTWVLHPRRPGAARE